jgi:hypothetical protein
MPYQCWQNTQFPERGKKATNQDNKTNKVNTCPDELDIEGSFPMEMTFPEDKKPIKFLGRTAYCMEIPHKTPKRYDPGIEFIEMNEKDRAERIH